MRHMPKTETQDNPANAVAPPSKGLPEPLSVELIAVASASDEEDFTAKFPVGVAIGEPVLDGKFPPVEDG